MSDLPDRIIGEYPPEETPAPMTTQQFQDLFSAMVARDAQLQPAREAWANENAVLQNMIASLQPQAAKVESLRLAYNALNDAQQTDRETLAQVQCFAILTDIPAPGPIQIPTST